MPYHDYYNIYLLLHIKHVLGDIKSYFRHSKKKDHDFDKALLQMLSLLCPWGITTH